jgi:predicted nucleic acid-binding Zn ribbon protein
MADPDNSPPACELCGKPLEEGEELVCSDRIECSERQRFWRTEEGM